MLRLLLILLLNAGILVCPFRCMSCEAGAPSKSSGKATCRCCHHESTAPEKSDTPADDEQDCGCKHCICRGALSGLERGVDLEVVALPEAFVAALCAVESIFPAAAPHDDALSWRLAGRPLRVFERSLQI